MTEQEFKDKIRPLLARPLSVCGADKKGKFPMGVTRPKDGGANLDVVPITHAMPTDTAETLSEIVLALHAYVNAT